MTRIGPNRQTPGLSASKVREVLDLPDPKEKRVNEHVIDPSESQEPPKELATRPEPALPVLANPSVLSLLHLAIEKGLPIETMKALTEMHERTEDRAAAREFSDAMAHFKSKCPPIPRSATGRIASKNGAAFSYKYADLDEIQKVIDPVLAQLGLSYTWDSANSSGRMKVTCLVRHRGGHIVPVSWESGTKASGAEMSEPQNDSKAWTTCRRQSLIQAFGLKTGGPDCDTPEPTTTITEAQVADLVKLIGEVGANGQKFIKWLGIEKLADLPASQLARAIKALQDKRKPPAEKTS